MAIKSLGQNWLRNREILDEIAALAGEGGLCVEIGPGLGTLTSSLLRRFDKVIAIELDKKLAKNLPKSFPGKNLEVVNEDVLKYDFNSFDESYVVAGNIPYYITSPIIKRVLELKNKPIRVVLLMQKEVAERITDEKETVLSLLVKNYAKVCTGPVVDKAEFTPEPKVDSQVVVMEPFKEPLVNERVFDLIRQGFKAPRKKLVHNLAGLKSKEELEKVLEKCGISRDARPGDVNLEKWAALYRYIVL
ncbi:ribosomal RNA small subunit methyltransferase A [Candidatus Saccharibacteria bacterium]|nr:ribosomal RNA small subunit methyltransferase A [Candidatus Saccharibacteria bacterium]